MIRVRRLPPGSVMLLLGGFILASFFLSMNLGMFPMSPGEVVKTLFSEGTRQQELVLFQFRLPRIILALMVGAGLVVSGAILQGLSRNGLADPGVLGINAGAGLAVVAYIVINPKISNLNVGETTAWILPLFALAGSFLAALLIYVFAWKKGVTPTRLLLVGIAVGAGIGAVMTILTYRMQFFTLMMITIWQSGSIWGANWDFVLALLPWLVTLIPLAIYRSRFLNVLSLGDHVATGLGVAVEKTRLAMLATSAALAASCVALGGAIGFVGLVGPHLARRTVGPNHRVLVPASALFGGLLVLVADMIVRNIVAPVELPVGIVVSGLGAPYFLYLLTKAKL